MTIGNWAKKRWQSSCEYFKELASEPGWILAVLRFFLFWGSIVGRIILPPRPPRGAETEEAERYYWYVDWYVAISFLAAISAYFIIHCRNALEDLPFIGSILPGIAVGVAIYGIVEIACQTMRAFHFDDPRRPKKVKSPRLNVRVIVLNAINYLTLIICFAAVYAFWGKDCFRLISTKWDWYTPIYFSVVTILTIGYGEIYPLGAMRIVVCVEAVVGFLFALLIL